MTTVTLTKYELLSLKCSYFNTTVVLLMSLTTVINFFFDCFEFLTFSLSILYLSVKDIKNLLRKVLLTVCLGRLALDEQDIPCKPQKIFEIVNDFFKTMEQ